MPLWPKSMSQCRTGRTILLFVPSRLPAERQSQSEIPNRGRATSMYTILQHECQRTLKVPRRQAIQAVSEGMSAQSAQLRKASPQLCLGLHAGILLKSTSKRTGSPLTMVRSRSCNGFHQALRAGSDAVGAWTTTMKNRKESLVNLAIKLLGVARRPRMSSRRQVVDPYTKRRILYATATTLRQGCRQYLAARGSAPLSG